MIKGWRWLLVLGVLVWGMGVGAVRAMMENPGDPPDYLTTDLQVGFPIYTAIPNGAIRILVPTASDSANIGIVDGAWNGGLPIEGGFVEPAGSGANVVCPENTAPSNQWFIFDPGEKLGTTFYDAARERELTPAQAQTEVSAGRNITRYLSYVCRYQGTGAIGGHFAQPDPAHNIQIQGLVNPALPAGMVGASINEAVIIPTKVQLLRSGCSDAMGACLVFDREVPVSALMQEVKVSATIEDQLTIKLEGVPSGTAVCGDQTTGVASNSLAVNFGQLALNSFTEAAQRLVVEASVPNGYVVLAAQDHPLARVYGACSANGMDGAVPHHDCIPNFGWEDDLSFNQARSWTNPSSDHGLGLSVKVSEANAPAAPTADPIFDAGKKYSRFANLADGETPAMIAGSETVARHDVYDLCYRLAASGTTTTGSYANSVIYTVTASF